MKKQILFYFMMLLGIFNGFSQQTTCGSTFTDPGGPNANYANSSNVTTTFCPDSATDFVTVTFSAFDLENNFDFLRVYDGSSASSSLIGSYTGTTIPAAITSSTAGGCLTFVFTSDSTVVKTGWIASVSCSATPPAGCITPIGLTVTNSGSATPTVSWSQGTATQWEVLVLPAGTAPTPTSAGVMVTTNSYQLSNLTTGTYVVYVRTICATDISVWSSPATVTYTPTSACALPTQLTATGITSNSASLSWANNSSATAWEVAVVLASNTAVPTSGTTATSNTGFLASGLTSGTAYKYYVRADCGNGTFSNWSSAVYFTTLGLPLTTPACGGQFVDNGGFSANYQNNTNSTITIYPTNSGEVVTLAFTAFDVEQNFDGLYVFNGNSTSAPQISSGNTAGSVPGGLAGAFWGTTIPGPFTSSSADGSLTIKFVSDSSVNKAGWAADVTCGPAPTCPAPYSLATSGITFSSATVSWAANGANQWEVLVQLASLPAPSATATGTLVTTNSYQFTGLTSATAYKAYVRAVCSSSDVSTWSPVSFTTSSCTMPVNFYSNTITTTSANIYYTPVANNSATLQIIVLPAGAPAPTTGSTGAAFTPNGYTATGLTCGTSYIVYASTNCNAPATWTQVLTFPTNSCPLTTGAPVNMTQCNDSSSTTCFVLTDNDVNILAGLNPTEYTINYYMSGTTTAPLPATYCVQTGTYAITAVLTQIATQQTQTFAFTITAQSVATTTVLSNMVQCDDNQDGQVVFDLTTQVSSSNPLAYYTSLTNATAQVNAIANPMSYSISATSGSVTIFVRETIANQCDPIYSFALQAYADCNLAHECSQANSLCGALGVPFPNTHQQIYAEAGNNYGCVASTPNPTWFYMPISTAGNINLTVEQNTSIDFTGNVLDVDYVLYGPFSDPVSPCTNHFTQADIVSCSFSAAGVEHPAIQNAQVGQYYILMTTNFSNQAGFIRITMDATSQGAMDCSGLRFNAFLDNNNNGTQDSGEQNFPLGQFHYDVNAGTPHHITSPTGMYTIYDLDATNTYNVNYTLDPAYTTMYAVSTSSYSNLHSMPGAGLSIYNFPVTSLQSYDDLAIAIIPITPPRAGTTYKNKIAYTNLGSQTMASGTVSYTAQAGTTITNVSQAGASMTANGFTYNFTNLLPFETRFITVTIAVPSIPTVAIGQLLTNTVNIDPATNDLVPSNNANASTQAIVASYDPNDKTESHGEKILFSSFSVQDKLYYTIRFENSGTASAVDVRVEDVLDSRIDETSVKMVSASHNYTLDRVNSHLIWKFDNIQLPVSVANTDIGKGYVTFSVNLKPGFSSGDIISNTASIYFDTNPAIITNTFNTEFVSSLQINNQQENGFTIYPNPAHNVLQLQLPDANAGIDSILIYDVLGKVLFTETKIPTATWSKDISQWTPGVYFVEVQSNNKKMTKKIIIE